MGKITRGTPEQFIDAVERQIAYLQGENIADAEAAGDYTDNVLTAATEISASHFPVEDVLDFLAAKGYDVSTSEVKSYAEGVADYMDMSREAYEHEDLDWPYTLEQWYKDTQQNYGDELEDLPKVDDIDAACNSCNTMSTQELSIEDQEKLYELADRYTTTDPVSGDWNSETAHEQQAIADEFGITLEEAKQLMIDYLGFSAEDITGSATVSSTHVTADNSTDAKIPESDYTTYDVVEAADEFEDIDTPEYDSSYIDNLVSNVDNWLTQNHKNLVESIDFDTDESNLYLTVTLHDSENSVVYQYTVPYIDLEFADADIDKDTSYITDAISHDISTGNIAESSDVTSCNTTITGDYDLDDLDDWETDTQWEEIAHKSVPDSDGFYTDYTMYKWAGDPSEVEDIYICVFGDNELYYPDSKYPDCDFSTSNEAEAYEWFDSYGGFDDDEDVY